MSPSSSSHYQEALRRQDLVLSYAALIGSDLRPPTSDLCPPSSGPRPLPLTSDLRPLTSAPPASANAAARQLGTSRSTLDRWLRDYRAGGFAALLPKFGNSGRKPIVSLTPAQVAAVRSAKLILNKNRTGSSNPEAIRAAARAGAIDSTIAATLLARADRGLPVATPSLRARLFVSEPTTRAYRSPREAWLTYIQSPGSLMLTKDPSTGLERYFHPGEAWTIDDGSINLGCCVPLERPEDECFRRYQVILGRFQFIPVVDHRTRFILGFNYTARPRDSYRAEDLTATIHTMSREHGRPRLMFLEHGVSASHLVKSTLELAGIEPVYVASPHQKVVEALFNLLWVKLSALPGQIGRFRGEMELEGRIYQACKSGEKDPRHHFPMLATVLQAIREAIAELNGQTINSDQYGRWIPADWFARAKQTRPLDPTSDWMFAPCVREETVRGYAVSATFKYTDTISIRFHYTASFLGDYHGARVRLYFNPFDQSADATIVLAAPFAGHNPGQVLGRAVQFNRNARFTRRALGYGTDPDIGAEMAARNAQALRRAVVAIRPDGKPGIIQLDHRDGRSAAIPGPAKSPHVTITDVPAAASLGHSAKGRIRIPLSTIRKPATAETINDTPTVNQTPTETIND